MLLIIQNGYITPCISRYLDEKYEIVKSYDTDVSKLILDNYSIVIILGGHQSVRDITVHPYLFNVIKLIKQCLAMKKPLFGICLGSQLVAHTLGCEIKSSSKLNVGYDAMILGYCNIFRCHVDYIVPNSTIIVLEYCDSMPYLYKYDEHIYGIQCHADMSPECVQKYSKHAPSNEYAKKYRDYINKNNAAVIKEILDKLRKT
jgi:GMP synthase-like glutamine amidotransferase